MKRGRVGTHSTQRFWSVYPQDNPAAITLHTTFHNALEQAYELIDRSQRMLPEEEQDYLLIEKVSTGYDLSLGDDIYCIREAQIKQ